MSKLSVDQKTIVALFSDKRSDFLIPDYQRPYAWEEDECRTLWNDLFAFAFPNDDLEKFDDTEEYYLGPIVTFKNNDKIEVIDGQQRLTTLMILLRAFYDGFTNANDKKCVSTKTRIAKCIWKTNEFDEPNFEVLKIDSHVATDEDKEEFLSILKSGKYEKNQKSRYAKNFQFFKDQIEKLLHDYPTFYALLPNRILNNCILLPIEAESQNTALRIFSTLNDRGLPLSDADIFKSQFYKYYTEKNEKDSFIRQWKYLEDICNQIFHPISGTPMDELFTRYMYYERALQKNKSSTTEALRKFYEKNNYELLRNEEILSNLILLANFWLDISNQDKERFSDSVLRRLFVLNYAPNGMWNYFVSVYFMHNKDENGLLKDDDFYNFLNKITAFILTYAITNPGVNALRTPIFTEMINIIENKSIDFAEYKFEVNKLESMINNYVFTNNRPITKSMITWWAFTDENQTLLSLEAILEIEHIYARNRLEKENSMKNIKNVETLGNKALLEKRINIRASDYKFIDKKQYYEGFTNSKGINKKGTEIRELQNLAKTNVDFTETDILNRNKTMVTKFIEYLGSVNLIK